MSKNKDEEFSIESYLVSAFHSSHPQASDLISELVNDFISKISKDFYVNLKENRNNKLLIESIRNQCILIINDKISWNSLFRSNLVKFEKSKVNMDSEIKNLYKDYLKFALENTFYFIKVGLILSSNRSNQKEPMKKLKIYSEYKPVGKKYEEGHRLIYIFIPREQRLLITEYGGVKKGKSDLNATVKHTVKILEKEKLIPLRKYDPVKIYNSYVKSDYFRQHKAAKRIKTLRNLNKTKN